MSGARLERRLGLVSGVGLAVSTIIGSGLLGLPGLAIAVGGAEAALAGWAATLAVSLPLMLIFMRLTAGADDAGGLAAYARSVFGPGAASAVTFVLALTFALCIPIGTLMGSAYLQRIAGLPESAVLPIAIGILVASTFVNVLGVRQSGMVNNLSVVALVSLLVVLVALNPAALAAGGAVARELATGTTDVGIASLWAVSAILFWAFLGWENLSFGSEEMAGGRRAVRAIFLGSFVVVAVLYLALALVSTGAARLGLAVGGVTGLLALVEGRALEPFVEALVALVVIANVNAWVFAASRLYFAAGRAGDLPRYLARVSGSGVPVASLWSLMAIYTAVAAVVGSGLVPLETGLSVANQNFIALYVFAIVAHARRDASLSGRILTVAASASCIFLLSGFGWWLLVPVGLAAAGYIRYRMAPAPLPASA